MLQYSVDSEDLIPEGMTELYEAKDGKFVLKVEGVVPKNKLDEFRNNNINLMKQRDEMQEKVDSFSDIDLEVAREAIKMKEELENKKLFDEGQFEELLAKNTDRMKKENEKKILQMQEAINNKDNELSNAKSLLSGMMVETEVTKVLEQRPQLTTAAKLLIQDRAKMSFAVNGDGKISYKPEEMKINSNGEAYGVIDYVDDLISEYQNDASFIKPSQGTGAVGSEQAPGINFGNQIKLTKAEALNPVTYRRAKAQATEQGKKVVIDG